MAPPNLSPVMIVTITVFSLFIMLFVSLQQPNAEFFQDCKHLESQGLRRQQLPLATFPIEFSKTTPDFRLPL